MSPGSYKVYSGSCNSWRNGNAELILAFTDIQLRRTCRSLRLARLLLRPVPGETTLRKRVFVVASGLARHSTDWRTGLPRIMRIEADVVSFGSSLWEVSRYLLMNVTPSLRSLVGCRTSIALICF